MTEAELKALYIEAYKIIRKERVMRLQVFRNKPKMLREKIGEMDRLMKILTDLKDELKAQLAPQYEQPQLLEVPRKAAYGEPEDGKRRP